MTITEVQAPTRSGPMATTVYEIRYTNPREWIAEARADLAKGAIEEGVVRLALRTGSARTADVYPDRPFDDRPTRYRSHYVEGTYLNRSGQLVKLSCFCGVGWPDASLPEVDKGRTQATMQRVQEVLNQVQVGIAQTEGVELRGGLLTVEEGAWQARTGDTIEAPRELACATCDVPIYWANGEWRHRIEGRELRLDAGVVITRLGSHVAYLETTCPDCHGNPRLPDPHRKGATINCQTCATSPGVRRKEHHLADPEEEGRIL